MFLAVADWVGRDLVIEGTLVLGFVIALVTAVGLLWTKLIRPTHHWLRDVHEVVTRELQVNGGSSMKDVTNAMQRQVEDARDERQRIQQTLDDHIADAKLHHQLQGGRE